MEKERNPQIVYFKDLLFVALKIWRIALIVGLIFALVLGCFKWFSSKSDVVPEISQEDITKHEQTLRAQTTKLEALQTRLSMQQTYLDNSYLMRLDPYNFQVATLQIYVDTGYQINPNVSMQNANKTGSVLSAYKTFFGDAAAAEQLASVLAIQPQYALELISCSADTGACSLSVSVFCANREDAEKALTFLNDRMSFANEFVSSGVSAHSVNILENGITVCTDASLASQQSSAHDQLTTTLKNLTDMQAAVAKTKASAPTAPSKSNSFSSTILYTVIGFVLGIFLCVGIAWLGHIFSGKVYSVKALQERVGIKVIGLLPTTKKTAFDRWLLQKEGRCTTESHLQFPLVVADICCRVSSGSTVLVTGSTLSPVLAQVFLDALSQKEPGVRFVTGDILTSPEALEVLKSCDAVLLVEACHATTYADVSREVTLIEDYGKNLVGCILQEG